MASVTQHTCSALATTGALFLGVVVDQLLDGVESIEHPGGVAPAVQRCIASIPKLLPANDTEFMVMLRNYVACPLGEELFFRSLMFHLLLDGSGSDGRRSALSATLWSAVIFSAAHFHHFVRYFELELSYEAKPGVSKWEALSNAFRCSIPVSCGDALVTAAFGLLSGLLFVKAERGALATAAAHAFCNYVGPPSPRFLRRRAVWKRIVVGTAYAAGIVIFAKRSLQ